MVAGPVNIVPLRGPILQAETCQILSLAENPRWSPSVAIYYKRSLLEICTGPLYLKKILQGVSKIVPLYLKSLLSFLKCQIIIVHNL